MTFYAYHGVHTEERAQGQRFVVDVRVDADLAEAGRNDDLTKTVHYGDLYRRIKTIVEGEPRALLEAVAEEIAAVTLAEFPASLAVEVTIRKPWAPIKGAVLDASGVRIVRRRR
jgi:dihydroneopterin aldolase